jgi:very-short-patch-repair endonuclease
VGAELDSPDRRASRVAAEQHGVLTREQLRRAGLGRKAIENRIARGVLHRVHRGVYAWGHPGLSPHGRWMAAVISCGDGAALSHGSAAVLWSFLKYLDGPIHVTSPSSNGRASKLGIVLHRSPSLGRRGEATQRFRIPVTSPRRTIEDLEGTVDDYLYRRAKSQAEYIGYELRLPTDRSRSDLERDFLRFLARHRFPRPEVNVKVGRYVVDFFWRREGLVVETDFFGYHRGSQAFEDDHQRDLDLRRMGLTVRRYTGAQLDAHPDLIVSELAEDLRRGAP